MECDERGTRRSFARCVPAVVPVDEAAARDTNVIMSLSGRRRASRAFRLSFSGSLPLYGQRSVF